MNKIHIKFPKPESLYKIDIFRNLIEDKASHIKYSFDEGNYNEVYRMKFTEISNYNRLVNIILSALKEMDCFCGVEIILNPPQ